MSGKQELSRRRFLKKSSTGLLAVTGVYGVGVLAGRGSLLAAEKSSPTIEYRTLGRTGMQYTTLGFGSMRTSDPAVIRKAIDMGINNIDTARVYMDGQNEAIVGKAIKGVRDKIFITTKIKIQDKKGMLQDAEASLKALGTEYVDILLLHSMKAPDHIENEEARSAMEQLKKEGKVRYVGFSTHRNMAQIIRASLKDKFFDVILVAYNFKSDDDLKGAIAEAAKANIGIIAMKTQAGGYEDKKMGDLSPHQAALKWVLSDHNVTCAIPSMVTFDQLTENFQVMGSKFGWLDRKTLHKYSQVIDHEYCRLCSACDGKCPHGVAISDVNRCIMYVDAYKDYDLARRNYRELAHSESATKCLDCDQCVVSCANGLDLDAKMKRAVELFA